MKRYLFAALLAFAAFTLFPASLSAQSATLQSAEQINPTTCQLVYSGGQRYYIDFYDENIFRVFRDDKGGIVRNPATTPPARILADSPRNHNFDISLKTAGGATEISTAGLKITLSANGSRVRVTNTITGKDVIDATNPVEFTKGGVSVTLTAADDEYFYGGGVQNGRFSHKGKSIAIENTNNWVDGGVASPTPFYWSTKGYGILWHTFKPGRYDFGESEPGKVKLSHSEDYLDLFVMVDAQPVGLLADFYRLTGNPVLLPKFGFYEGHLNAYNRDYWKEAENGFMLFEDGKRYNESQKDNGGVKESLNGEKNNYQFSARAAIDRYLNNDMPLGWFLPNDGYGAGYGQTGSLDGNIQNLKDFGDYARSKGVEVGLWTQSDLHPKAGVEPLFQRDIVKEVRDAGVRVLKTDVAWVGAGYSFGLNGVSDVGQIMPYYGHDARPFIISLDGWAGTQRYAGIWSGDQTGGDWEYIRFHIPTFIGSGLSGQPNITSDLDGIFGGKNMPVNIREFQWKTFTPMELNMDGWGSSPKYPQALGEPATSINRSYLKLKSILMPYTYSIAHEAVDQMPIIRAMFLEYPNKYTLGSATQYQYLFGPSLLVAPIYQNTRMDKDGNDIRNGIYLPEGKWVDFYNGDTYEGGRIVNEFNAPIWKLPVFVKANAIIPITAPNNNPSQIRPDYRAYEIYATPGGSAHFAEYDDDGKTTAYKDGYFMITELSSSAQKGALSVSICPAEGRKFEGFEPQKATELFVNVSKEPKKVSAKVGGKKVGLAKASSADEYARLANAYYYDAAPNLNRFATKGTEFERFRVQKNPQLRVKIGKTNILDNAVDIKVEGFEFSMPDRLLTHSGTLAAPRPEIKDADAGCFALTPSWPKVDNADYYEVEYDSMLYSTIRGDRFTFDGLTPLTDYTMRVRAVNRDGHSEWATVSGKTKANPLEHAVKGIRAQTSCENQGGAGIAKLFDFDKKSMWHTKWGKGDAVPFDLTIDLRSINKLDRLEYLPREDAANGTIMGGTVAVSLDRQSWSTPEKFVWKRDSSVKTLNFAGNPSARYVRLHVDSAVGGFGSGREMYVFRVPGSESVLQGDINHDKRIDENDFTSYMNYTGLRKGDADFDYVSSGDVNGNGLIDAYDISCVATELDGGVGNTNDRVAGTLELLPSKKTFAAGDTVEITVRGKGLQAVNALSFELPYDATELQYSGVALLAMKDLVNLTYDRLHTDGTKALYPTFVNRGYNYLLDNGDHDLFRLKFVAKKAGKLNLKPRNGLLVDRNLGTVKAF